MWVLLPGRRQWTCKLIFHSLDLRKKKIHVWIFFNFHFITSFSFSSPFVSTYSSFLLRSTFVCCHLSPFQVLPRLMLPIFVYIWPCPHVTHFLPPLWSSVIFPSLSLQLSSSSYHPLPPCHVTLSSSTALSLCSLICVFWCFYDRRYMLHLSLTSPSRPHLLSLIFSMQCSSVIII